MHLPHLRALACAAGVVLGACGDDGKSDDGTGTGGAGARFTASGLVLNVDDDTALARVTIAAPDGTRTTTDARGRYSISAREGDPIAMSASGLAPVTKRALRGPAIARMKAFDATATITPATGGVVRNASIHAAARLPAGALTGTDDADVVLAALDPRKRSHLSAITGDYTARRGASAGRVSIASPLYVSTVDPRRATLSPGAQVDLEFPAWVPGAEQRATLFAYDDGSADWLEIGTISAGLDEAGAQVYRGRADRLGWLAVGEFVGALACVKGCVNDTRAEPVASARVTATGVDDFSEVVGATDAKGCFSLNVRANAKIALEVATDAAIVHQQTVQTTSGSECQDLGEIGPMESQVPTGTNIAAVVERMLGCGFGGRGGLTRALEVELTFVHDLADGAVIPAARKERYEGYFARYIGCMLQAPCEELASIFCSVSNDDDDDGPTQPTLDRCTDPIAVEADAYDESQRFRCLDGTMLEYSDYTCDSSEDCEDGSDETNAACLTAEHYACGSIVGPREWRCDGEAQCAGGADEVGCFACDGGELVRPTYRCDGWSYCADDTDEANCADAIVCPIGSSSSGATATPFGDDGAQKSRLHRALGLRRPPRTK